MIDKKKTLVAITMGMTVFVAGALYLSNSSFPSEMFAGSTTTYKHYNAIEATDDEHGCCEFWVNCSDYSYFLEAPTEGTIVEGGDIKDNPSFDWDGMDILDERFVPSINEEKSWGLRPVLDSANNKITYGLFPQTHVNDADLIAALNALPASAISDVTGYYYYEGNFYQTCLGDKRDNDNHFADGEKVVNGTKYWFLCEPVSWVIMNNTDSQYLVYTEKAIHAGVAWGYSTDNNYETSQVRDWLNGYGSYTGKGFLQEAFEGNKDYLRTMSLSLDDDSDISADYARLLTKGEANDATYFADNNARKITISDWAAAHHACFSNGSSSIGRWWLCEANTDNTSNAWGVGLDGKVGNGGPKTGTDSGDRCERPVVTIAIE